MFLKNMFVGEKLSTNIQLLDSGDVGENNVVKKPIPYGPYVSVDLRSPTSLQPRFHLGITLNISSGSSSKTEAIEFTTKKEKWFTEKYSNKCIRSDAKNISFQYAVERIYDTVRDKF